MLGSGSTLHNPGSHIVLERVRQTVTERGRQIVIDMGTQTVVDKGRQRRIETERQIGIRDREGSGVYTVRKVNYSTFGTV